MFRSTAVAIAFSTLAFAPPVQADTVERLFDALGLPGVLEVMRDEGIDYGGDIRDELFPGRGGVRWTENVATIYDTERMSREMIEGMDSRLEPEEIAALVAFFESDRGRKIVELELSARRAMVDEEVEELAKAAYGELREASDPVLEQLDAFAEANDLVEANVMGAMNANYAFYVGLIDGHAFGGTVTEDQVLRDVWNQEEEIRADSEEWVYAFLTLAYRPLVGEDLEAYVELSRSEDGQALNTALFAAFDEMYVRISRNLGQAAASFMVGEDI